MVESTINSILAADCGSATTTVALIERVAGKYRLIATGQAPSTYAPPWQDIRIGLREAIRHIEAVTERTLLTQGGRPILSDPGTAPDSRQQGVDAFIAVSSAGPPLQMMVAGLMQDITLTSARRATATTYTRITSLLSLDANHYERYSADIPFKTIQEEQPEVILLVGGTDGGAERPIIEMANIISLALQVFNHLEKPHILYAGNIEARAQIAEILGPVAPLKMVDNIRPALDLENIAAVQMELESLYIEQKMSRLPGFQKLRHWTDYPIIPAGKSFEQVIAYIGRHHGWNVIGADIGCGATAVAAQTPTQQQRTIRSDAGIGYGLASLLKLIPIEKIHRWLSFDMSLPELHNQLLNKSLHPTSIPTTYEDLIIEHAVAREALRLVIEQARANWPLQPWLGLRAIQWNLMIGAGRALTRAPQPGYAVLIMLDAIEPWGVTSLALDSGGVVNMLGSIATIQPLAAVEVARDAFLNLGTVVALAGHGQPGKPALNFKISYRNGDTLKTEIPYGAIEVISLPPGEKATLEIRPDRYFDIGLGQPGRGALAEVEGGILGIIIDARGRPLRLPKDDTRRQMQLRQWLAKLGVPHANSDNNH